MTPLNTVELMEIAESDCTGTRSKEHELLNYTTMSDLPKTVFVCMYCPKRFIFDRRNQ